MKKIILLIVLSAISIIPCFSQLTNYYKLLNETSGKQKTDSLLDIVDYELSLPFAFQYKNFELKLAAHSAFPLNIIPGENLKPFLYYTVGFSFTGFFGK